MSKIVKVSQTGSLDNSGYRIKVEDGATITLDTGRLTGKVYITGDLDIQGTTTTIESVNTTIKDNIIQLNQGETGNGVTQNGSTSGIEIERGTRSAARLVFDETVQKFVLRQVDNALLGVVVSSVATDPTSNLQFDMQNGSGVLRVTNSTGYETRVLDNNDIPNKKFLTDYISAGIVVTGQADVDRIYQGTTALGTTTINTEIIANSSNLQFLVRSGGTLNQRAQITSQGLSVDNVNIYNNTVQNNGASNLILTALNNNVEVNGVLNLDNQGSAPTGTGGTSRIYSQSTMGPGKSGIYFANSTVTDELVSKNRAVLLSILL